MPKQQTIGYNKYTGKVFFYEGVKQHNRIDVKMEKDDFKGILKILNGSVNSKRKTDLEVSGFGEDVFKYLKNVYKRTRINLIKK